MQYPTGKIARQPKEKCRFTKPDICPFAGPNFSQSELSEWEEWEMLCYDDMIKQIRRGHVCKKCWTKDQKLYDKYYDTDNNDDFIRLI